MKNKKIRVALLGAMSMLAGGQTLATPSVPSTPLLYRADQGKTMRALDYGDAHKVVDEISVSKDSVKQVRGDQGDECDWLSVDIPSVLGSLKKSSNLALVISVDLRYFDDKFEVRGFEVTLNVKSGQGISVHTNEFGDEFALYGDWSSVSVLNQLRFYLALDCDDRQYEGGPIQMDRDGNFNTYKNAFTFKLVSYDEVPALVNGGSQTINVNLDDPVSLDDIKSRINAYDLFGQDLDFTMTPKGNPYDPSSLNIGSYTYTLHCEDQWGQEADATLIINVVDITAPTVTPKAISKGYSDQLTFDDLKGAVIATDTSTSAGGGGLTYKFTASSYGAITAEKPLQLTAEMAKAGSLSVSAEVSDSSGNTGKATIQVTITDNVAPVIARTGGQEIDEVIQVPLNTMDDAESAKRAWLANYTATDAVDGEVAISVEGFPESFSDIVLGEMEVTLKATDKAGNEASQVVKIDITSTAADLPYYVLDDLLLSTTGSNPLSAEMIATAGLDMLTDDLGFTPSSVSVGEATYQYYLNHYQYDGTYQIVLNYTVPSTGVEGVAKAVGAEAGLEEKSSVMTIESYSSKKRSIWTKIADWFSDTWQRFCNWFTGKGWHTDRELEIKAATADSVIE